MKVAISLPDPLFSAAETLADQLRLSRSQLYAQALAEYIDNREHGSITEKLNAVYGRTLDEGISPDITQAQAQVLGHEAW